MKYSEELQIKKEKVEHALAGSISYLDFVKKNQKEHFEQTKPEYQNPDYRKKDIQDQEFIIEALQGLIEAIDTELRNE